MRERERRGQRERERLLSDYDERVSGSSDPPHLYLYLCLERLQFWAEGNLLARTF